MNNPVDKYVPIREGRLAVPAYTAFELIADRQRLKARREGSGNNGPFGWQASHVPTYARKGGRANGLESTGVGTASAYRGAGAYDGGNYE